MDKAQDIRTTFVRNGPEIVGTTARLAAVAGVFLPWAVLDDSSVASNGPELAMYFWEGADREYLRSADFLKFVGFCAAPWVVAAAVLLAAVKPMLFQRDSVGGHFAAVAGALVFLYCGVDAVDDRHVEAFGLFLPLLGMWAVFLGTTVSLTLVGARSFSDRELGDGF